MAAKNSPVRITPVIPCCDHCLAAGFARAEFDFTEPFSIVSGFKGMSAKVRRDVTASIVANAAHDVVILVSDPVPAHLRDEAEKSEHTPEAPPVEEPAAPSVAELNEIFGVDDGEAKS